MTPETMPSLAHTAHMIHFLNLPVSNVFIYDPAADGPECEVITRILAHHPFYRPGVEKRRVRMSRMLDHAALVLFQKHFDDIGPSFRSYVVKRVAKYCAAKGLA